MKLLVSIAFLASQASKLPCKGSPKIVGPCFTVHGRLRSYNGNPAIRIWRIGTNRILGVLDTLSKNDESPWLPGNAQLHGGDYSLVGDFEVCPLTVERKGWMQMVCVDSATDVRRAHYP